MLEEMLEKEKDKLIKEMGKDYAYAYRDIKKEIDNIDFKYDDEGNLKDEKQLKKVEEALGSIIIGLWLSNGKKITETSKKTIETTNLFYDFLDKELDTAIEEKLNLSKIVSDQIRERNKKIGFKTVINGNAKATKTRIYSAVAKGVKGQKTPKQVEKEVRKLLGSNGGKATTIARTEVNTHRSLAKQTASKRSEERGNLMKKTWIYTGQSAVPRLNHVQMDGEEVYGVNSFFSIGAVAPQQFGDPAEDINCTCTHIVEYVTPISFDQDKYDEFVNNY